MRNPNLPPAPTEVLDRGRVIAAKGAIAFAIEQGPNKITPEVAPELTPEAEPTLTDDAADHIANTLSS